MKRALSVAALLLALVFAGQTALAPAAHAEGRCQPAVSVADILSPQENEAPAEPAGLVLPASPMEKTHGGRIPHCGDYCEVEGQGGGCVYYQNGVLVRTTATCQDGVWTPTP